MSIGDALAAARREAGLTITQVSQRTCIRETIVRGIERGDYSACGGDFYARGHIRSIARAVGLDPDELVREYDATQAAPQPITAADVFQPFTPVKLRERRRANWSIVLAAGLVAVLAIVGFRYWPRGPAKAQPTASTRVDHPHKPKVTPQPVVHTTAPQHVRVTVVAKAGSVTWALAKSAAGVQLFQGDIGGGYGSRQTWTEKHLLTLQLGYPGGAIIYLNGVMQRIHENNPVTLSCNRQKCAVVAVG